MATQGDRATPGAEIDPESVENQPAVGEEPEATEDATGRADAAGDADGLSKDQAFDVLRNGRRRAAVSALREAGGRMEVSDLAAAVAAAEYDVAPADVSSEQYKRVYTGLYQCHLPRMDDLNVVTFDSETNTVRLRDPAADLAPYLEESADGSTARRELASALAVAGAVTAGVLAPGPLPPAPPLFLTGVTVVALFGFALFHLTATR